MLNNGLQYKSNYIPGRNKRKNYDANGSILARREPPFIHTMSIVRPRAFPSLPDYSDFVRCSPQGSPFNNRIDQPPARPFRSETTVKLRRPPFLQPLSSFSPSRRAFPSSFFVGCCILPLSLFFFLVVCRGERKHWRLDLWMGQQVCRQTTAMLLLGYGSASVEIESLN